MESETSETLDRLKLLQILFEGMANLMVNLGEEEKKTHQPFFFQQFVKNAQGLLTDFSETLTPEELGTLMKLFIKLANYGTNLQNVLELSAEDKIIIGKDIRSLSEGTEVLITDIEKRTKQ